MIPGLVITHGRSLRQGDPLSPLLFDLAIDPLPRIIQLHADAGLVKPLPGRLSRLPDHFHCPTALDVTNFASLLHNFGEVLTLTKNVSKSSIAPNTMCCNRPPGYSSEFSNSHTSPIPIKYLRLHLSLGRLCLSDLQPFIDNAASRRNPLKGKIH